MTTQTPNAPALPVVELKPCPFCGGQADRYTIGDEEPNNAGGDVICCQQCGASSHVEFGRKENLVSRWNGRADDAADTIIALCEALEEVRDWLRYVLPAGTPEATIRLQTVNDALALAKGDSL